MKKIFIFFLFYSLNFFYIKTESKLILANITDGIYNIVLKKKLACLTYVAGLRTSREQYGNSRLSFRFSEVKQENNNNDNNNNKYFTIKHIYSNIYIGTEIDNDKPNSPIIASDKIINNDIVSYEWQFIKVEENAYLIRNKNGCYLKEDKIIFVCENKLKKRTYFHLLKLYTEVSHTTEDLLILEKEPIDIFIKYIDLSDPNLVREGVPQIKKDEDNEELRYCIRSILQNIPWIRKIFILMPNEKVRYFKDYEFIKEKIIYVKDKDLLGYDSSNSHAFQFRIWKMKQFGLSDNFIYMDDDYFIGEPLQKSDFFYVENNKVLPSIINTKFEVHTNITASREYDKLKEKILNNQREQTSDKFMYSVYKAYLLLIEYFNNPIIVPYFTHNAIPSNLNDIKEVYDFVYNSKYKNETLDAKYRHIETLQFQTSLIVYIFNKYKRKTNPINYNYIDNADTIYGNYKYPLFCINTGNNNDYSEISFSKTKLVMENLFPIPTQYEIYNYSIVPDTAYKVIKILRNDLEETKKQKVIDDVDKEQFENDKISEKYKICNNKVDMYKAENDAYIYKNKKRKLDLENCAKNFTFYEQKKNELNIGNINYTIKEQILEELEKVKNNNEKYINQINTFKNQNDDYLKEIKRLKNKEKKTIFMIYLQLILIILFVLIVGVYYPLKKKKNSINRYNNKSNLKSYKEIGNNEKNKLFDEMEMNLIK